MKKELGFMEILVVMLVLGVLCFIFGFMAGCFPPERKQFWKNAHAQAVDLNYGAGKKP